MKRSVIFIISFLLGCIYCLSGTKRALVIGLGEQEDKSWRKIHGDNDVYYVKSFLDRYGYEDITTLVNDEATKCGIIDALQGMANRCNIGDDIYIHFSGHGQMMTDVDGDEEDNWDEAWIPYDAYMHYCDKDRGEKHLSDDELYLYLTEIRKAIGSNGSLIVAVDSCHSGDSTCGEEDGIRGVSDKFNIPIMSEKKSRKKTFPRWMTISACRPYELSAEIKINGISVGKLTYALYVTRNALAYSSPDLEQILTTKFKDFEGRIPQNPTVTGKK